MDVREKLVELLNEVQETGINEIPAGFGCTRDYVKNEKVASHLIANGVTVQKWISVKDRLPDVGVEVLVYSEIDGICVDYYDGDVFGYFDITHWMPMPKPPKGV